MSQILEVNMNTNPIAWHYNIIGKYNILSHEIRLFEDQLEPGTYPLFADCTTITPLPEKEGHINHFNIEDQKWEYVENHIGEMIYINDVEFIVKDYGPLPKEYTTEKSISAQLIEQISKIDINCKIILSSTDYLLMVDYPLSEQDKLAIIEFRNTVRNMDKLEGYPWLKGIVPYPSWPLTNKTCPYVI